MEDWTEAMDYNMLNHVQDFPPLLTKYIKASSLLNTLKLHVGYVSNDTMNSQY